MNIETQECTLEGVPASLSIYAGTPSRVQFYIHIPTPGIALLDLGLIAIMPPAYEIVLPDGHFCPSRKLVFLIINFRNSFVLTGGAVS